MQDPLDGLPKFVYLDQLRHRQLCSLRTVLMKFSSLERQAFHLEYGWLTNSPSFYTQKRYEVCFQISFFERFFDFLFK